MDEDEERTYLEFGLIAFCVIVPLGFWVVRTIFAAIG
jgi:hypothetical protein